MSDLIIIVEGEDDENFLKQLIKNNFETDKTFQYLKIKTNASALGNEVISQIDTQTVSLKKQYLFILDADSEKLTYLDALKNKFTDLDTNRVFFFPNNTKAGNLETLVKSCIPELYKDFLDKCIEYYARCVNHEGLENYNVDEKDKLFIYFSALSKSSGKGVSRIYKHQYFDFNHSSLDALKSFLKPHLQ